MKHDDIEDYDMERSDRRGFGKSFPHAIQGLSRSDWGLNIMK